MMTDPVDEGAGMTTTTMMTTGHGDGGGTTMTEPSAFTIQDTEIEDTFAEAFR